MNALVVYFSQTGNTRRVAEAIGRGLEAAGCDVTLRPLAETGPGDWTEFDLFALGVPVFYYREPDHVRAWTRALDPAGPLPAFTFLTHGGNPTNTLRRLQRQLRPKGGRVLGSFQCTGYDTYPIYLKSFREWGHPDDEDLAAAEAFGRDAAARAEAFRAGEDVSEARYRFVGGRTFRLSWLCRRPLLDWLPLFPSLEVDEARCTRCGLCAKRCPTANITLDPYPVFHDRCIFCYLCEKVCPHNAIPCDWTRLTAKMNP